MGVLTMELEKMRKDIIKEVENINKTLEKANKTAEVKPLNTNDKKRLKTALNEYITEYFENNKGGFIGSKIDECKQHFKILKNRYNIINEIGENHIEYEYLQGIYDNIVNKTYKRYKEDYKATWNELDESEKAYYFKENFKSHFERLE